jgi:hypothetical protein
MTYLQIYDSGGHTMSIINTVAPVATDVTLRSTIKSILTATTSLLNVAPAAASLLCTNVDSLQRLSNAGNLITKGVEANAQFDFDMDMIKLATKKTLAQRAADQQLLD